ncbi:MAG TPA: carboxypeptidase-like regulatory domain-containing protein [Solirubrobacterales bacterium]|nr:carboxypeptidase-like regulatory domain-containing protein [Solirubrobacterales bacterium]
MPRNLKSGNLRLFLLPLLLGALLLALPSGATAAETGTIAGRVTDEGGEPIVEVMVCAEVVGKERFKCDSTRQDGTYELTGLAAGEYKVGFWADEGNYVTQFFEHKLTWEEADAVPLAPGETRTIETVLKRGATISGRVTTAATGAAVADVEACATFGVLERCAKTDAAGEYTIDGLVEGNWTVYFYAGQAEGSLLSQPFSGGTFLVGEKQAMTGVDAQLVAGGQIAGTVHLASTGAPAGGVLVCATAATSSVPLACLRTPSSGAYRFTGIWAGSFKVAFSPELKDLYGPERVAEAEALEREEAVAGFWPDAYPTQWWSGQTTFDAATPIVISPPGVVGDIDDSIGPPAVAPAAPGTAPVVKKSVLKCRRGFVKRKVRGKQRCLKRHKARPKPRPRHRKVKPKRRPAS